MLHVSRLSKSYGIQTILDDVSFVLNRGERAGLVGVNGAGKTTLLRIIAGIEQADAGFARLDAHATLGYLPQGQTFSNELSLKALVYQGVAEWDAARVEMETLAGRLGREAACPEGDEGSNVKLLAQYTDAVTRFEDYGGYAVEAWTEDVLRGLGLHNVPQDLPIEKLSGGQRTRAGLARLLIAEPSVLLLDEPTNHLDVDALEWLEEFIRSYAGAALVVSHDRVFLDHTVSQILELDDMTHRVTIYHGNYSDYEGAKARELEQQWSAWHDQETEIHRLEQDIARTKEQALWVERTTTSGQPTVRRYAKKVARKAKSREKKLERYAQSEDRVEKPRPGYALKLDFGDKRFALEMPRSGQMVLQLEQLGHTFDALRFTQDSSNVNWLFRNVNAILRHGERIALVGANGTGKSTLLKIMVGELQPTEGQVRLGTNVRIGYMPQEQETLDANTTPLAMIRALMPVDETDARHFLHYFMFEGDQVFTPIGKLSYGERARLILAKLVSERANVLVLDEPINHLDIPSRERFEAALDTFPGTILVAVHDRAFIDRFATSIWTIEQQTLRAYPDRASMLRKHPQ